ncbi:MAG: ABC transporter permease [Rhodanobacter sp.]
MLRVADFKYALRLLKRSPGFTLMTVLVLAGGLAISIYTHAVLGTMLYKALPLPDSDSIVRVLGTREGMPAAIDAYTMSEMRQDIRTLTDVGVYSDQTVQITDEGTSRSVNTTYADINLFQFAGVKPLMGRGFVSGDEVSGAERVAVISYKLWQSVFGGDPDILDKTIRINHNPTRIVGVMPQDFAFPVASAMWLPFSTRELRPTGYIEQTVSAYGRIAKGASLAEANIETDSLLRRTQQQHPRPDADEKNLDGTLVSTFQMAQMGPDGPVIYAILNVVSIFILLLACVNVGNMLLARTNERIREVAVRVALGAPRWRLVMQMMLDSVIMCLTGGALAILLAGWALHATNRFLNSNFEGDLPYWWHWGMDAGTILAGAAFVLLAIALVSALPTYSATRVNANTLLRDGTRGARGRASGRISRILVTIEIVLISVIMLVGSAMAIVAFRAAHVDYGMDITRLLTMPVDLDGEKYAKPEDQLLFFNRTLDAMRRDSDIEAAMVMQDQGERSFAIDDAEYGNADDYPKAMLVVMSGTPTPLATRLVAGRGFDDRDTATGMKSIVVSEALAKAYWPGSSPLGRRVRILQDGKPLEQRIVVGIVGDIRRGDNLLTTDDKTYAALYVPMAQMSIPSAHILARYRGSEQAGRAAMQRAVASIDSYVVPGGVVSYNEVLEKITLMATTMTDLFVRCGLFAILLAMTGIYGLTSNAIVQRTQEIGVRRALGATDQGIIRFFLRQAVRQLAIGFIASGLLSIVLLYLVAQFTGVSAITLVLVAAAVAGIVSALVFLASVIASRRAVSHPPAVSLRYE